MNSSVEVTAVSGLHILEAVIQGKIRGPSIGDTMPMKAITVEHGKIVIQATPDDRHLNPLNIVHGGFAATCLDGAAGLALFSILDATTHYSTVDLNVKYVRPLKINQTYEVSGWVVERSKSLAICDAQICDAAGKLYAKATTTFIIKS